MNDKGFQIVEAGVGLLVTFLVVWIITLVYVPIQNASEADFADADQGAVINTMFGLMPLLLALGAIIGVIVAAFYGLTRRREPPQAGFY